MGVFYTTTVEYRTLQILPWELLNSKCISKLAVLYYLLPISMALLFYMSYASIFFLFQEQHFKMDISQSMLIIKMFCGSPYFFPQEHKEEIVHFTLQCFCSEFASVCGESFDEIKWVEKNFMECARSEAARNKPIYARLMLRV